MDPAYIATWMHADGLGEESTYPAVRGVSSAPDFQAVYWRCVVVFFAVSVRQNDPGTRHLLYTNVASLPHVDGIDVAAFLSRLGVEVVQKPYSYAPPDGYYPAWRNQFYVFDALEDLAARASDRSPVLLLDSDVLIVRSVETMSPVLDGHGALTYVLGFPDDHDEHGLTAFTLGKLAADLDPRLPDAPLPYCGGEAVIATGAMLRALVADARPAWTESLRRFEAGEPYFREEAHLLTYLYRRHGVELGTGNPFVRRIWTALFREAPEAADVGRALWHLPGEKRYGLKRLFGLVADPGSPFWRVDPGEPLRRLVAREVGIPRRTFAKTLRDLVAGLRYKLGAG